MERNPADCSQTSLLHKWKMQSLPLLLAAEELIFNLQEGRQRRKTWDLPAIYPS
jgi:hypothetical protein